MMVTLLRDGGDFLLKIRRDRRSIGYQQMWYVILQKAGGQPMQGPAPATLSHHDLFFRDRSHETVMSGTG